MKNCTIPYNNVSTGDMVITNVFREVKLETPKIQSEIRAVGETGFPDRKDVKWDEEGPRILAYKAPNVETIHVLGIAHSKNPDSAINKGIRSAFDKYVSSIINNVLLCVAI